MGNSFLFVCKGIRQACAPVTLSVKDGLHHDLNARATDDLEGPSFPYGEEQSDDRQKQMKLYKTRINPRLMNGYTSPLT